VSFGAVRAISERDAVRAAFACTDQDLPALQVDILDPQLRTLELAHASAVQQAGNQLIQPAHVVEHQLDFGLRQHGRPL
jgi:hypothetical protein